MKSKALPTLSHLQFAVLNALDMPSTGKLLRERLAASGFKRSGPSFYQMMARLEEAGFVNGRYDQKIIEGQLIKERAYNITKEGVRAVGVSADFYKGKQ